MIPLLVGIHVIFPQPLPASPGVYKSVCVCGGAQPRPLCDTDCACGSLLGWVEVALGCLQSEEDVSLTQQVTAVSRVEESIYMEASAEQPVAPER